MNKINEVRRDKFIDARSKIEHVVGYHTCKEVINSILFIMWDRDDFKDI